MGGPSIRLPETAPPTHHAHAAPHQRSCACRGGHHRGVQGRDSEEGVWEKGGAGGTSGSAGRWGREGAHLVHGRCGCWLTSFLT